jgi:hypothetical protein
LGGLELEAWEERVMTEGVGTESARVADLLEVVGDAFESLAEQANHLAQQLEKLVALLREQEAARAAWQAANAAWAADPREAAEIAQKRHWS